MFEALIGNKKPMQNNKSLTAKKTKADLRKVVSQRFIEAREMNGMSQTEGARKMGFANSTQLSLWEKGVRLPPIDQMIVASVVYGVSLDFLYGLSDEPERDPRQAEQQALLRQMEDMLKANADAVSKALMTHVKTGGANMLTVKAIHARAIESAQSIRRFVELNSAKFQDMRGSATVLAACEALETLGREVQSLIARHDGIKEHTMRTAEAKGRITHPLFETLAYRQHQLGIES